MKKIIVLMILGIINANIFSADFTLKNDYILPVSVLLDGGPGKISSNEFMKEGKKSGKHGPINPGETVHFLSSGMYGFNVCNEDGSDCVYTSANDIVKNATHIYENRVPLAIGKDKKVSWQQKEGDNIINPNQNPWINIQCNENCLKSALGANHPELQRYLNMNNYDHRVVDFNDGRNNDPMGIPFNSNIDQRKKDIYLGCLTRYSQRLPNVPTDLAHSCEIRESYL